MSSDEEEATEMMVDCPRCEESEASFDAHCYSPTCTWLRCEGCGSTWCFITGKSMLPKHLR